MTQQLAPDVLIIGAGVAGSTLAYELAIRGVQVEVLDRGTVASGSSGVNGGNVRSSFTSPTNIALARRSFEIFQRFAELSDTDIGFEQHGYLYLFETAQSAGLFAEMAEMQSAQGLPTRIVSADEAAALLGRDVAVENLTGGCLSPLDGHLDPYATTMGFANAARRHGATFRQGVRVTGITTSGDRAVSVTTADGVVRPAGTIVNAAGVWAPTIGALHGARLPITPWRSQIFALTNTPTLPEQMPLVVDFDNGKLVLHRERRGVLCGMDGSSSPEPLRDSLSCDWSQLERQLTLVTRRFRGFDDAQVRSGWAGYREITPDENPLVGQSNLQNVYVNAGYSGHGMSLAPAIAGLMASELIGEHSDVDITEFRADRFDHGVSVADGSRERIALR